MKNTNNSHLVPCYAVKDNVFANGKRAQAGGYVVAGSAYTGRIDNFLEPIFDLAQVFSFLGDAPFTPGVLTDALQVFPGGVGYSQPFKVRQRMRPVPDRSSIR